MNAKIQKVEPPPPPQPRIWTPLDLINWTKEFFTKKGIESPRLEAEMLLADVLKMPRIQLYVNFEKAVSQEQLATYREYVKRRADTREPIQYILGQTEFIDIKLKVAKGVLIPRPETELLALWAVERLKEIPGDSVTVLDLCTGSGCLALFIAAKEPRAKVVASDLSPEALAIAKKNAEDLKLTERIQFVEGDLFAPLDVALQGQLDLIVSNPPYIDPAQRETLQPEVRDHEPASALFADEQGLAVVRRIVSESPAWLKTGGRLGVEFGFGQHASVQQMAEVPAYASRETALDNNKIHRFLHAQKA